MKYNEVITSEYGKFAEISSGQSPLHEKPKPTDRDYSKGNFVRVFVKKINDDIIIEISNEQANRLNKALYKVVYANWTIIGPRESRSVNGIIEKGVSQLNRFEIDRIRKEEYIDLSGVLTNLLEYWRGH